MGAYSNVVRKNKRKTYSPNVLYRIAHLMNVFHSIDDMSGYTKEEKNNAKETIRKEVDSYMHYVGNSLRMEIPQCFKSKVVWESVRDKFL